MKTTEQIPVLILAYNKPARLAGLLTSLLHFGFSHFWISIDGPRDSHAASEQEKINHFLDDLAVSPQISISVRRSEVNLGGPLAIPLGISWFYSCILDSFGLILEEDLQLIRDPKPLIRRFKHMEQSDIIGGTLFTAREFAFCQLAPLFEPWGWFMNGDSWNRLRLIEPNREVLSDRLAEIGSKRFRLFWLGVYDRIYQRGGTALPLHWDYDVYIKMLQENLLFLHPPSKLCVNHGYGSKAQNTYSLPAHAFSFRPSPSISFNITNQLEPAKAAIRISHMRHFSSSALLDRFVHCIKAAALRLNLYPFANLLRNKINQAKSLLLAQQATFDHYRGQELLQASGLSVNIGSGETVLPGYLCVDARDVAGQGVIQFSPYLGVSPNSLSEIYCSHVLEHFPYRQIPSILSSFHRAIARGGVLRIAVPDFSWFVAEYSKGVRLTSLLPPLFGGQNYDYNYHMGVFDRDTLLALLVDAGFSKVESWDSSEFFSGLGCDPDFSAHPCSLNLLATK